MTIRGKERHNRHPSAAAVYGAANALIVDEAALLLDLKDVYWASRAAPASTWPWGLIATGGLAVTGVPLWPTVVRELRR